MALKRRHVDALRLGSFDFEELFDGQPVKTFLLFKEQDIVEVVEYLHNNFPEDAYPTIPLKIADSKGGSKYVLYVGPDYEI